MAAVDITISGVLYDKLNRTQQAVVLIGEATLTGLGIGGGPIIPPGQPPISPGVPTHPIMLPGMPGWGDPHPAHPIVLPDPPPEPPTDPPNVNWKWAWTPAMGWHPAYVPEGGKPQPIP